MGGSIQEWTWLYAQASNQCRGLLVPLEVSLPLCEPNSNMELRLRQPTSTQIP